MMANASILPDDYVVRLCVPTRIVAGSPDFTAFLPMPKEGAVEEYLSCNWLGFFGRNMSHEESVDMVRQTKLDMRIPATGVFALVSLEVARTHLMDLYGIPMEAAHYPEPKDPSHSGLHGFDPDCEVERVEFARVLCDTIVGQFPAKK